MIGPDERGGNRLETTRVARHGQVPSASMKVSLDWLNSYFDRPCLPQEAETELTRVGFPEDGQESLNLPGGATDTVIDFEVTSNRSDCLSHIGLARELAAATGRQFQAPQPELAPGQTPIMELAQVENDQPELCPLYTARVITGIQVGPSPKWLRQRLEAIGLRPINNVVDVTNFVLHELGQPLHAFDLDKLAGHRIVIRCAQRNEPFVAIDGSKHQLQSSMLVIADAQRPVAIAGIMGGLDSEVDNQTTNLLIESAIFDPLSVRQTSRTLKLSSDSSFRFERGVDPRGVDAASQRVCALIVELTGATLTDGVITVGRPLPTPRELAMRCDRCNALLGTDLSPQQQAGHLERLGLQPQVNSQTITCTIPTYRLDLQREVDLIEEVARHHGLDNIAVQEKIHIVARPPEPERQARQTVSRILVGHGFHETVTSSFIAEHLASPFLSPGDEIVSLFAEQRKAESTLRPSLLPSLLACRKLNQDSGNQVVSLFEIAATWTRVDGEIQERRRLALLRDAEDANTAARLLRGCIEEMFEILGGPDVGLRFDPIDTPGWSVAATIRLGPDRIGQMGILDEQLRELFDLQLPLVVGELDADATIGLFPPKRHVRDLPRYPAIERDLSVVIDDTIRWDQVAAVVRDTDPALLEQLRFLGTYHGKPIPLGHKSLSLRLIFRDPDTTLRHEQVDPQVATVIAALRGSFNAQLRG